MDFVHARARFHGVRGRRRWDRQAGPLERHHRSTPCRALADTGNLEDLDPVGVREQRAAGDDDRLDTAERIQHVRELVANALERGLRNVRSARREREPTDRPAPVGVPTE